jgi:hypothetical protein
MSSDSFELLLVGAMIGKLMRHKEQRAVALVVIVRALVRRLAAKALAGEILGRNEPKAAIGVSINANPVRNSEGRAAREWRQGAVRGAKPVCWIARLRWMS